MDLVQRVFSFLVISLILSCNTNQSNNIEYREILVSEDVDPSEIYSNISNKIDKKQLPERITSGSISTILLDGSDLWIGKLGGALIRYNLYTKESKVFQDDNYSIKDYSIKKILKNDREIVVLQSDRILRISKSTNLIRVSMLPHDVSRASDIVEYKNRFYLSTLGYGLLEYDDSRSRFNKLLPGLKFISSLELNKNTLYIGSMNNGLYSYNLNTMTFNSRLNFPAPLFRKNITKLKFNESKLLLGTAKNGLIKWDINKNSIDRIYPKEGVSFIYSEPGLDVVSFIGHGLYLESKNKKSLESIKTSLVTNNITSVAVFNNHLITGNIKKGIIKQELNSLND